MCRRLVNTLVAPVNGGSITDYDEIRFEVSDIETVAREPSYTLTTARQLRSQGFDKVNWLIGADQLNSLPSWHEPRALLEEVNFIVVARPGYELNWSALPEWMRHLQANVIEAPRLDISATEIRRRVAAGLPIDWLTPAPVVEYIRERGLYRSSQ